MIRTALRHFYGNLERYFCAFLMVLMVFCLGSQVFFRFVLNASLTWSEELSRFAFIWLVYMGAVLGTGSQSVRDSTARRNGQPVAESRAQKTVRTGTTSGSSLRFSGSRCADSVSDCRSPDSLRWPA